MHFFPQLFKSKKIFFLNLAIFFLLAIALISMLWPTYRAFFKVVLSCNEGWNAFFGMAAVQTGTPYPRPEELITNNYPPLSFYFVGYLGSLFGDLILTGRLLSLFSIFIIGLFIGKLIKELGGHFRDAVVGSAFFIATMGLFFSRYVGMNDPQLLAQCIMMGGVLLFLKSLHDKQTPWLGIIVMVTAGFFKHNIITLPFSLFLWLLIKGEKKLFFKCLLLSLFFMTTGFALCYWQYGHDFLFNFFPARRMLFSKAPLAFFDLSCVLLPGIIAFFILWKKRTDAGALLLLIMLTIGTIVTFLQRIGSGVSINSQFDVNIAISAAIGLAFHFLKTPSFLSKQQSSETLQLSFLLLILLPFFFAPELHNASNLFSRSFYEDAKRREGIVLEEVEKVQNIPGDVFCENSICYRAGKPFVVDFFNINERIKTGKISPFVVTDRIRNHLLTKFICNPDIVWPSPKPTILDRLKAPFRHSTTFEECCSQSR